MDGIPKSTEDLEHGGHVPASQICTGCHNRQWRHLGQRTLAASGMPDGPFRGHEFHIGMIFWNQPHVKEPAWFSHTTKHDFRKWTPCKGRGMDPSKGRVHLVQYEIYFKFISSVCDFFEYVQTYFKCISKKGEGERGGGFFTSIRGSGPMRFVK